MAETVKTLREAAIAIESFRQQLKMITAALGVGVLIAGGLFFEVRETNRKVDSFAQELNTKIESVARQTNIKIETVAQELNNKIDGAVRDLNNKIDNRIDGTNKKIDAIAVSLARIEGRLERPSRRSEIPPIGHSDGLPAVPAVPGPPAAQTETR